MIINLLIHFILNFRLLDITYRFMALNWGFYMKRLFLFLFCIQVSCLFSLADDEQNTVCQEDNIRQNSIQERKIRDLRDQDRI